ncbi:MAG TPA: carboxypeptidase-like regulatory domain-containing protein [Acidobacteriaceae bacterium]|jgi:hypothetical protein|nr:carboxypeptidase-like regulatory domain-containing protein [Acidobacteriaceae bacterium]
MTRKPRHLRCTSLAITLLAIVALVLVAPRASAQDFGVKQLQGKVFTAQDSPIGGAIVYLQNSRNNDIKSYISDKDGAYHFADISADTDYTVWAAFQGKKTPTKTVSAFDSRKKVFLDLHMKE